jgi:hypothetical protein
MKDNTLQMPFQYYVDFVKILKNNSEMVDNNHFFISYETIKNKDDFLDLCSLMDIKHDEIKYINLMELYEALKQKLMKISLVGKDVNLSLIERIEFEDNKIYIAVNKNIKMQ